MSACPAYRSRTVCTNGQDFGPCPDCLLEDQMENARYGIPLPDYEEAQRHRSAAEIRKLQAAVKSLSAAVRKLSK